MVVLESAIPGAIILPIAFLFAFERKRIRFFYDRIEVSGLWGQQQFPRASANRVQFFARKIKTADRPKKDEKADEPQYAVYMLFGFNEVKLGILSHERARAFVTVCHVAEKESRWKHSHAFEVVLNPDRRT
jgi:hypothetical protein